MLIKMAWVVAPLSERLDWLFLRMMTAGRIMRSAWLLSKGTCGWSRNVNRLSQYRRRFWGKVQPVKMTGAEWMHMGVSHIERAGCTCENTQFDVDEFGRVFYPDMCRFYVGVLDTNGNLITQFGGYGNAESMGPDSPVIDPKTAKPRPRRPDDPPTLQSPFAKPEIAFAWLIGVAVTDKYAYMGDSLNRRLLRAKLVYAAEETCPIQ